MVAGSTAGPGLTSPNHFSTSRRAAPVSMIARDDEARVRRRVVLLEERHDVVVAGGGEVRHVADDRPVIRMSFGEQHLGQRDLGHAVRPILVALSPLVLDDVALRVDGLRRHRLEQVAHAIRFEEQRELERVRRHVDPVIGAIVLSRAVVVAAGRLEQRVELARHHVPGAHEHEVFEQMREAGSPGPLAAGADVVPHVDRHERHAVILVQDHVQPVGQRELRVGHLDRSCRCRGLLRRRLRGDRCGKAKREQQHGDLS